MKHVFGWAMWPKVVIGGLLVMPAAWPLGLALVGLGLLLGVFERPLMRRGGASLAGNLATVALVVIMGFAVLIVWGGGI